MTNKNKKDKKNSLIEDPSALIKAYNSFFQDKHKKTLLLGIGGIIALAAVSFTGYNYYVTSQNVEAQEEMFPAQFYFEKDSLDLALNGDGNNYGFLDIIEEFPYTKSANLSCFYAGVSYLKLGDFENAVRYLHDFNSNDIIVQARAYSLIGDAFMEQDLFQDAIIYFKKASKYKPNNSFTPIYLKKLAIAQEQNEQIAGAIDTYKEIEKKYPNFSFINEVKKKRAWLEAQI